VQPNVSGYGDGWKCAAAAEYALLKPAGMQQFRGQAGVQTGEYQGETQS
jgi:hypothetical protein